MLFVIAQKGHAQYPQLDWAVAVVGGISSDDSQALVVDDLGNIYYTGRFQGAVDFDPGPGTFYLNAVAGFDIFISKLDSSGNLIWAIRMGGSSTGRGYTIELDDSGYLYTGGTFGGTFDFDPDSGNSNTTSSGGLDFYIAKYDTAGNYIWVRKMGAGSTDVCFSLSLDALGNIYSTGYFTGTVDFDPGAGVFDLTPTGGYSGIFISKLDESGNFVWAKEFSGGGGRGQGIIATDSGDIYVAGYFIDTTDFDPGAGAFTLISIGGIGKQDVFVCKLDSSGGFLWASSFTGSGSSGSFCYGLTLDDLGNVYTTGSFQDTVDFDPGPGSYNIVPTGINSFISKLSASGQFRWVVSMKGASTGDWGAITHDEIGDVYMTGVFYQTVDFDPGPDIFNLTAIG